LLSYNQTTRIAYFIEITLLIVSGVLLWLLAIYYITVKKKVQVAEKRRSSLDRSFPNQRGFSVQSQQSHVIFSTQPGMIQEDPVVNLIKN
jgi:hypothetical protein